MVTIDAMGAQKAIAEEVIRGKADYVLALKGNHESLHMAVIEHIDERLAGEQEPDRVECRYGQYLLPMRHGLRNVLASPSTTRPDRFLMPPPSIPARAACWWWNSSVSRRRAAFSASCCSRCSNQAWVGPNMKATYQTLPCRRKSRILQLPVVMLTVLRSM